MGKKRGGREVCLAWSRAEKYRPRISLEPNVERIAVAIDLDI